MFDWLVEEMASIKTHKFHLVDGTASLEFGEAVQNSGLLLPPSYKAFVLQFGNAKLYRRITSYSDRHLIEVYAGPREAVSDAGEPMFQFGRTESTLAYFKEPLLVQGGESPVFEWRHGHGLQRTAEGFLDWLRIKCKSSRRQFKKKEWEAIEHGPPPFTDQELAIVEARKLFRWRVIGVSPDGDLRFEIHNGSNMILPFLSLEIRGNLRPPKTGPLHGGIHLPISFVRPGETKTVEHDCYKELVAPKDTEVFEQPYWGPEDREQYWELKPIPA